MYLRHDFPLHPALELTAAIDTRDSTELEADPLTPLDRAALEIGRRDAFRFGWDAFALRSPLWLATWGRLFRLLGIHPVQRLASARLEGLRLYACTILRGDRAGAGAVLRLEGLDLPSEAVQAFNRLATNVPPQTKQ